jgi:release factor glutamine methyltransferase
MQLDSLLNDLPPGLARRDAELLAAHVLACERAHLLAHPELALGEAQALELAALMNRRALGEPLQYLTGVQEFYGLPLAVSPAVLIPRPETELLVEHVLLWAAEQGAGSAESEPTLRIVDVGTGSGAIAIALATHLAGVEITALDASAAALAVARENARTHHVDSRIQFLRSDLLHVLEEQGALEKSRSAEHSARFDAIVANLPYVPHADAATLQLEVVAHEPHTALFAGDAATANADGLDLVRRLIAEAREHLRSGGLLALEFGFGQRNALAEALAGWHDVRFVDDYAGIARIALATR